MGKNTWLVYYLTPGLSAHPNCDFCCIVTYITGPVISGQLNLYLKFSRSLVLRTVANFLKEVQFTIQANLFICIFLMEKQVLYQFL